MCSPAPVNLIEQLSSRPSGACRSALRLQNDGSAGKNQTGGQQGKENAQGTTDENAGTPFKQSEKTEVQKARGKRARQSQAPGQVENALKVCRATSKQPTIYCQGSYRICECLSTHLIQPWCSTGVCHLTCLLCRLRRAMRETLLHRKLVGLISSSSVAQNNLPSKRCLVSNLYWLQTCMQGICKIALE